MGIDEVILKSLSALDGIVRVEFAIVALGIGINLRDVNTVIHYGAPQMVALEDLVNTQDQLRIGNDLT